MLLGCSTVVLKYVNFVLLSYVVEFVPILTCTHVMCGLWEAKHDWRNCSVIRKGCKLPRSAWNSTIDHCLFFARCFHVPWQSVPLKNPSDHERSYLDGKCDTVVYSAFCKGWHSHSPCCGFVLLCQSNVKCGFAKFLLLLLSDRRAVLWDSNVYSLCLKHVMTVHLQLSCRKILFSIVVCIPRACAHGWHAPLRTRECFLFRSQTVQDAVSQVSWDLCLWWMLQWLSCLQSSLCLDRHCWWDHRVAGCHIQDWKTWAHWTTYLWHAVWKTKEIEGTARVWHTNQRNWTQPAAAVRACSNLVVLSIALWCWL